MKTFQIKGVKFAETIKYYDWDVRKEFPEFERLSTVDLGTVEFASLYEAQLWLAKTHPDLYFGANIIGVAPEKKERDFMMVANKGYYYSLGIKTPMDAIHQNI